MFKYLNISSDTGKHIIDNYDIDFDKDIEKFNNKYKESRKENIINVFCKFHFPFCSVSNLIHLKFGVSGEKRDKLIDNMKELMKPTKVSYVHNKKNFDGITYFVNKFIKYYNSVNSKYKIAIILESDTIRPQDIRTIKKIYNKFDLVLTYNKELLETLPNAVYMQMSQPCLSYTFYKLYKKKKLASFMFNSAKSKGLIGYKLRTEIYNFLQSNNENKIDVFKASKNNFITKDKFLCDYMFTIICFNSNTNFNMFDTLIDSFVCRTIPIYYGIDTEHLNLFFYEKGVLHFNSLNELIFILENYLNKDYYEQNFKYVEKNFIKVKEYYNWDDSLIKTVKKNLYIK